MANKQEIVKILKVETQGGERTVQSLKKEIEALRNALLNVDKSSEDYNTILTQLRQNQSDLTEAMTAGKQGAEALEGSYNFLNETLKNLRKEWKSTTDEVRRNELGKEIDNINSQLKEMDASIGNYQRNVGNYANDITKALEKQNNTSENTIKKLSSIQKMASGLASGYSALQGTMALFGVENENLERTFIKLQSAIAMAQGFGGLKDLIEGMSEAKKAFKGAELGIKTFKFSLLSIKGAIISTGIGALVVLLGVLISKFIEFKNKEKEATKANIDFLTSQRELNAEVDKLFKLNNASAIMANYATNVKKAQGNLIELLKAQQQYNRELENAKRLEIEKQINDEKALIKGNRYNNYTDEQRFYLNASDAEFNIIKDSAVGDVERKQMRNWEKYREREKENYDALKKEYENSTDKIKELQLQLQQMENNAVNYLVDTAIATNENSNNNAITAIDKSNERISSISETIKEWKDASNKNTGTNEELTKLGLEEQSIIKSLEANKNLSIGQEIELQKQITAIQNEYQIKRNEILKKQEIEAEKEKYEEIYSLYETQGERTQELQKNQLEKEIIIKENANAEIIKIEGERNKQLENTNDIALQQQINEATNKNIEAVRTRLNLELQENKEYYDKLIEQTTISEDEILNILEASRNKQNEIAEKYNSENEELRNKNITYQLDLIKQQFDTIDKDKINADDLLNSDVTNKRSVAIQMEIEKETELYNQKSAILHTLFDDEVFLNQLSLEQKEEFYNESVRLGEEYTERMKQLSDERIQVTKDEEREKKMTLIAGVNATMDATVAVSNALVALTDAEMSKYEEGTEAHKNAWEQNKKMNIASTIISTLQGATDAFMSAQRLPQPYGAILGGILAASTLAMGYANVEKIRQTTYEGGNGGNMANSAIVTPNINPQELLPIEYTRNLQTNSETAELNKPQRVYVLESDITEAQNKVKVVEDNATF